jgi:putative salt-induced outer membrane protein YdiY
MTHVVRRHPLLLTTTLLLGAIPGTGAAQQDSASFTWENATELSFVSTGGNASSSTLGLKATLKGTGGQNTFKVELGGIRGHTNTVTRTATGTSTSFTVIKTTVSQLTAGSYFVRGRYVRDFRRAFVFSGSGWDRNTFAGVQNRYSFVGGFGMTLADNDSGHLKIDLGATYTIQKDVDPAPDADEGFAGFRLSFDAKRTLSESTDIESALVLDENVEQTGDLRADWINSLSVSLTESLAFKTSLQLLFDNRPALLDVPLVDGSGVPTGTRVSTPGEKLDRLLTLTMVIKL